MTERELLFEILQELRRIRRHMDWMREEIEEHENTAGGGCATQASALIGILGEPELQ